MFLTILSVSFVGTGGTQGIDAVCRRVVRYPSRRQEINKIQVVALNLCFYFGYLDLVLRRM